MEHLQSWHSAGVRRIMYYDLWVWDKLLRYAQNPDTYDYVSAQALMYPRYKVLPQVIRNGFDGKFYDINPIRLIAVALHHFEGTQVNLNSFNYLSVNFCRKY